MKKVEILFISVLVLILLVLGYMLSGCGSDKNDSNNTEINETNNSKHKIEFRVIRIHKGDKNASR